MAEGKLRPLVSQRYSLAETARALEDMAARKVVGKVVIVP
jgi:NADPH2:quinone reductase